jgi:transposase-like protein
MKKRQGKRHTPEQIIRKLREADTLLAAEKTIGQVVQALGISEQTFHRWRNQYGGMKSEEAKRLKKLEQENKRLKKLLAEAELDKAILKEAMEGNY